MAPSIAHPMCRPLPIRTLYPGKRLYSLAVEAALKLMMNSWYRPSSIRALQKHRSAWSASAVFCFSVYLVSTFHVNKKASPMFLFAAPAHCTTMLCRMWPTTLKPIRTCVQYLLYHHNTNAINRSCLSTSCSAPYNVPGSSLPGSVIG